MYKLFVYTSHMEKETEENEVWKSVNGYPDYYISSLGRLKSTKYEKNGKILKPWNHEFGYKYIYLYKKGNKNKKGYKIKISIHRIMAKTFLKKQKIHTQVAHLDGNPRNNNIKNLKWVTAKENASHKYIHGTQQFGEKGYSKLTERDVRLIRELYKHKMLRALELSEIFLVSRDHISAIINRFFWKHI